MYYKAVDFGFPLYTEKVNETKPEAEERRETICKKCRYWDKAHRWCDYLLIEGKLRPCHGSLCVQKGVFKPKQTRQKAGVNYSFNGGHKEKAHG